jgi:hypothetical protein
MDDSFMESYSDALNQELSNTSIKETFSRAPHHTNDEVNILWVLLLTGKPQITPTMFWIGQYTVAA